MAATYRIVRGVKTNRLRRVDDVRKRGKSVPIDRSPQRAKLRQKRGELDLHTVVSVTIAAADLQKIDERCEAIGYSRSRYLVEAGLLLAGHVPPPLGDLE